MEKTLRKLGYAVFRRQRAGGSNIKHALDYDGFCGNLRDL